MRWTTKSTAMQVPTFWMAARPTEIYLIHLKRKGAMWR